MAKNKIHFPISYDCMPEHLTHVLENCQTNIDSKLYLKLLASLKQAFATYTTIITQIFASCIPDTNSIDFNNLESVFRGLEQAYKDLDSKDLKNPDVALLIRKIFEGTDGYYKHSKHFHIGGNLGILKQQLFRHHLYDWITSEPPTTPKAVETELNTYLPVLLNVLRHSAPLFKQSSWSNSRIEQGQGAVDGVIAGVPLTIKHIPLYGCSQCVPEQEIDLTCLNLELKSLFIPQGLPLFLNEYVQLLENSENSKVFANNIELFTCKYIRFMAGIATGVFARVFREQDIPYKLQNLIEASLDLHSCEAIIVYVLKALKDNSSPLAKRFVRAFYDGHNEPYWHTKMFNIISDFSNWALTRIDDLDEAEITTHMGRHIKTLNSFLTHSTAVLANSSFKEKALKDDQIAFSAALTPFSVSPSKANYLFYNGKEASLVFNEQEDKTQDPSLTVGDNGEPQETAKPSIASIQLSQEVPVQVQLDDETEYTLYPSRFLHLNPISLPQGAPHLLENMLKAFNAYLQQDDGVRACRSAQDILNYLVRYFAGIGKVLYQSANCLPEQLQNKNYASLSIQDAEQVLLWTLLNPSDQVPQNIFSRYLSVFYNSEDGKKQPNGYHTEMLEYDADPNIKIVAIAAFISLDAHSSQVADRAQAKLQLKKFYPAIADWVQHAGNFFSYIEHFEAGPDPHGQVELTLEYPIEEGSSETTFLELVAPDYAFYVRPGSDEVPTEDFSQYLKAKSQYLKERAKEIEKTRRSKYLLQDVETRLFSYEINQKGRQTSPNGYENCYYGTVTLNNPQQDKVTGFAFGTHPGIEVSPAKVDSLEPVIEYWIRPDSLPEDRESYIILKVAGSEIAINSTSLVPQSFISKLSFSSAIATLFLTAITFTALVGLYYLSVASTIEQAAINSIGKGWYSLDLESNIPDFVKLYRPKARTAALFIYLWPAFVTSFFYFFIKRASFTVRTRFEPWLFPSSIIVPSSVLFFICMLGRVLFHIHQTQAFSSYHYASVLLSFTFLCFLNSLISNFFYNKSYINLGLNNKWAVLALRALAFCLYLSATLVVYYL